MPMVEIDEAQLNALRQGYGLLDKLVRDPKTKAEAEKLIKAVKPDAVTSADLTAEVDAKIAKLREEFEGDVRKRRDREQDDELRTGFNALRQRGFQEEGIEEVKKLMVNRNIPDVEAAAALFERLNPPKPQAPSGFAGTGWGFGAPTEDPDMRLLFSDPDTWADKEAAKVFTEMRSEG